MKSYRIIAAALLLLLFWPLRGQNFVFHSEDPFNIKVELVQLQTPFKTVFLDKDNDGDLDLMRISMGFDTSNISMYFLLYRVEYQENIGTPDSAWFAPTEVIFENFDRPPGFFFPAFGDLNGDNEHDFAMMGHVDSISEFQHLAFYLENGEDGEESYDQVIGDSLGLGPMTPRSFLFPELTDLDRDGDLDIILYGTTTLFGDLSSYERVVYYGKNFGTPQEPQFYGWFKNPYGLKQDTVSETMIPGDIDNDGDVDMISLGTLNDESHLFVLENVPDEEGRPSFLPRVESPYGLPTVVPDIGLSCQALADIDSDGDLDFFILQADSMFRMLFYENTNCQAVMSNDSRVLCSGDTLLMGGLEITTAGQYAIELQQSNGCDSIVNLTISKLETVEEDLQLSVCEGDSVSVGGHYFDQTGEYEIVMTGANGCDSIIVLTLDVVPAQETHIAEAICDGEVYTLNDIEFSAAGTYQVFLTGSSGCDSIVNLDLEVLELSETSIEEDLCAGDIFVIAGEEITESGTYQFTIPDENGCDSTINAIIVFHEVNSDVQVDGLTLTASMIGASYQWFDCTSGLNIAGATEQSFTPQVSGIYAVRITDQFGCTAESDCIDVIVTATREPNWAKSILLIPNPATDMFFVDNSTGREISDLVLYAGDGRAIQIYPGSIHNGIDISNFAPGVIYVCLRIEDSRIIRKLVVINRQ